MQAAEPRLVYQIAIVLALIIFICIVPFVHADETNESIALATTNGTSQKKMIIENPPELVLVNSTIQIPIQITSNQTSNTPLLALIDPLHNKTKDISSIKTIVVQYKDPTTNIPQSAQKSPINKNSSNNIQVRLGQENITHNFAKDISSKSELKAYGVQESEELMVPSPRLVTKYDLVTVDSRLLQEQLKAGKNITISIGETDYPTELSRMNFENIDDGIDSYYGTITDIKNSEILFTTSTRSLLGRITLENETYWIFPVESKKEPGKSQSPFHIVHSSKDSTGEIIKIDDGPVPIDPKILSEVSVNNISGITQIKARNLEKTPLSQTITVNLLVVTDQEFYQNGAWLQIAQNIIAEANSALTTSDINVVLNPIYDDSSSRRNQISTDDRKVTDPLTLLTIVYPESVLNSYNADLAIYLGGNNKITGNDQGASAGYGVVDTDPAAARYAWAQMVTDDPFYIGTPHGQQVVSIHEIGHMFGACHEDQTGCPPYAKAYTFWTTQLDKKTVMWHDYSETASLIFFSSKNQSFGIYPLGDKDQDNSRNISETRDRVAAYANCDDIFPPAATYSWNPPSANVGTEIIFHDDSGNVPISWHWDFGDGSTSSEQHPRHTYSTSPQTSKYSVRLTAANCAGSSITEHDITITSPTHSAFFSGAPQSGPAPLAVQFTDKSTPTPSSWSWDFGDGHTSSAQNPQNTYSAIGSYSVNLTVVQGGVSNTTILENYISVVSLTPDARFSANITTGKPPLTVAFSDLSTKSPTSWSWNFGDGGTSNLQNPVHTYSNEGNYDVSLVASNGYGSSPPTTAVGYISLTNTPLQNGSLWNLATPNAQWPEKSYFAATVYNNKMWVMGGLPGKNDVWSSGDGITWTQATAAAPWPGRNQFSAVTFNNKMWVLGGNTNGPANNDVWYSTSTDGKTWEQAPVAVWVPRYDHTAVVHQNRIYVLGGLDNSSAPAAINDVYSSVDGVIWNQATNNAKWTARYGAASVSFNGKIWIFGGMSGTRTRLNDVWYSDEGLNWTTATANAAWSPRYQPQAVVYDNKIWILGGEDTSGTRNDVWYSADGVTWTQATGAANWAARSSPLALVFNNTIWIVGGSGYNDVWYAGSRTPVANFTTNNTYGTTPLAIAFTDTSNNAPTSWLWNFGDNQTSTQKNPVHRYASDGIYTVSLRAINAAGNNTLVRDNLITVIAAPLPNGVNWSLATPNAAWPGKSNFAATVYDNKMWVMGGYYTKNDVWSSGDGKTWTQATAAAPWAGRNRFSAVTFNNKMWVLGGIANGNAQNDVWYSTSIYGNIWTKATAAAPWAARYDQTALVHNNRIYVLGGQDNSAAKNDVWSSGDGIIWNPATNNAQWTARRGSTAVSFNGMIWLLGGKSLNGTLFNDVWNSTDGGTWTRATANAAWSPRYQPQAVVYDNKIWIIGGTDTTGDKNDVWYSVDGKTWTQATGNANWDPRSPQALVFNNTMWVVGGSGYNDVWYARSPTPPVQKPVAGFTSTPASGTAPLTVIFTDTSTNTPTGWQWDFGDGNTTNATVQNPVHTYLTAGTYTVSLNATNSGGSNTTIKANYTTATIPIIPLPGMSQPPTDPDNDGIYEDLNGNNRIDFSDVVLYFNQMTWIAANEPIAAFDVNGNGRIDFNDTVVLFNEV